MCVQIDCIVTSAGGIEEDFIKCLAPTYLGDFALDGRSLRDKGINRIGNLLVPNNNYCKFEDWVNPILDKLLEEQNLIPGEASPYFESQCVVIVTNMYFQDQKIWTPSSIIERLGHEINDKSSIYYWAAKNKIPVFSPALTDGSLGDMFFFHSFKKAGLVIDILQGKKTGQYDGLTIFKNLDWLRSRRVKQNGNQGCPHWNDHSGRGVDQASYLQCKLDGESK